MSFLVRILAEILTFIIPCKNLKNKIKDKICVSIYGFMVFKKAKKIGKNFRCGDFSSVSRETEIGNNVWFSGMKIVSRGGGVYFGDYVRCGAECLIITSNHNYKGETIPFDTTYISKDVRIEDFAWLGSRVTILPGTIIGKGAIIQAGSVVHGKIPDFAIAGGNPCKVFSYRDIEHFKKLEEEKKFLNQ